MQSRNTFDTKITKKKQQNVENHMDGLRHTDEYKRPIGARDEELLVVGSS
jgi:hypothetical protein